MYCAWLKNKVFCVSFNFMLFRIVFSYKYHLLPKKSAVYVLQKITVEEGKLGAGPRILL